MEGNFELLKMELSEINIFARHHFQLYLGWYTFFLTVNFGAIGWFTSVLLTGALKVSLPVIIVAVFFVIQLVLSLLGSLEVRRYFQGAGSRSREILEHLATEATEQRIQPRSAIPVQVYLKIIWLICCTLWTFMFFWVSFTVVSLYLVPLR